MSARSGGGSVDVIGEGGAALSAALAAVDNVLSRLRMSCYTGNDVWRAQQSQPPESNYMPRAPRFP